MDALARMARWRECIWIIASLWEQGTKMLTVMGERLPATKLGCGIGCPWSTGLESVRLPTLIVGQWVSQWKCDQTGILQQTPRCGWGQNADWGLLEPTATCLICRWCIYSVQMCTSWCGRLVSGLAVSAAAGALCGCLAILGGKTLATLAYLTGSTVPSFFKLSPHADVQQDSGVQMLVSHCPQLRILWLRQVRGLFDTLMRCDVAVFGTPRLLASQMILSPIQLG